MKRLLYIFLIGLTVPFILTSCSRKDEARNYIELGENLDLGEGVYRPNPLNSLDEIPPFSWMGMPDSVIRETQLEITFNEDAVRSHSSIRLGFVDQNGNSVDGIHIGQSTNKTFTINADTLGRIIPISVTVNPSIGDSILTGSIVVLGNDLDIANGISLNSSYIPIATWSIKHKIGINWLRWSILILIITLILCLIGIGIYYSGPFIIDSIGSIPSAISGLFSGISIKKRTKRENINKNQQRKDRQKKKEKEEDHKLHPYLRDRQTILRSSALLRSKATALYQIVQFLDYDIAMNPKYDKDEQYGLLDKNIRDALENLWAWSAFYLAPSKNGIWTGESKNSIWIPEDSFIPKNRSYSNVNKKTWAAIKKQNAFTGLTFHKGIPQFKDIAKESITMSDFGSYINAFDDGKRTALHEKAFELLAKRMGTSVDAIKKWKEDENNPLVWHEHVDCSTMYLVPQEIHGNINHFGGIGMLKILRRNNLTTE